MNSAEPPAVAGSAGAEVETLHSLMVTATQQLLGATISVTDEQWRAPSLLPGWTRGHVATHLARQADALRRIIRGAIAGPPQPMYASSEQRSSEIESGAGRSGLELQIDLDTSAGALSEAFDSVSQEGVWDAVVELRGGDQAPVRLLPLARLCEVVLHHVDLDIGFGVDDIDQQSAEWLLEWMAFRLGTRHDFPKVQLVTDSGLSVLAGTEGERTEVHGQPAQLLGWLSGRATGEQLSGVHGLTLPAF